MIVNAKTGFVPCEILVSEAGLGLRAGEVRGLLPAVAETMISRKSARALTAAEIKAGSVAEKTPAAE